MTPEQALIHLFRQAASRLRRQIRGDLESGRLGTAVYRAQQLRRIETELRRLGQRVRPLSADVVAQAYSLGVDLADRGLEVARAADALAGTSARFTGSHTRAAEVIAENMARRLENVQTVVGRRVDDVYRRVAIENIGIDVPAGGTRRELSARLARDLEREALTGFVDRAGRNWQMDTYTEMVARTTTRETMTQGTRNRLLEVGHDLVTISDHQTETEICQVYEGRTFSLTGATEGYDVLDQDPPFHPNCKHVITAGTGDLDRDLAVLEATIGTAA